MTLDEARAALNAGDEVATVLQRVWHLLDGGDRYKMAGFKLDRVERMTWRDPVATFQIERHGDPDGQLQTWMADLGNGTANCIKERPLSRRAPGRQWDERPVAAELARLIRACETDPRLHWRDDRRRAVKVRISESLPLGFTRATADEASRLRAALAAELADEWERDMAWWVRRDAN